MIYDTLTHHRKGRPLTKGFKMGIFKKKQKQEIVSVCDPDKALDKIVFKNISFSIIATYWQETEHTFLGRKKQSIFLMPGSMLELITVLCIT